LREERYVLLDPCHDDPDASLVFQLDGRVVGEDERGQQTIATFALNRDELIRARLKAFDQVTRLVRDASAGETVERLMAQDARGVHLLGLKPPWLRIRG
jgi:hypothetical protein